MLNINKAAIAILSDIALHSTPGELNIARLAVELGVEVARDEGRDRGQIQGDDRVDHGARTTRETIQAPPGERPKETTTSAGQKDPRRPLLPAPFGACGDGYTPETVRKDKHGRLLVYEWRAAVKTPSVHTVPIVDGAAAKALEGRGGGVRVGAPAHPFGQTLVGR